MTTSSGPPEFWTSVSYSDDSSLNTLDICLPRPTAADETDSLWVVYIHGGAWRDPTIDSNSFRKTQDLLLRSSAIEHIAGFASINYRLSSYPSHLTDPSDPSDPARNAKHPDHINDILKAILYLQEEYHIEERYVLIGHSCGATLALQVAMKRYWGAQYESTFAHELNVVPPRAIIGFEGIYDLPELVDNHKDVPVYEAFITNAFGGSREDWKTASPVNGSFDQSWEGGEYVILAHSRQDELVEWDQASAMLMVLQGQGWAQSESFIVELRGKHDDIWQDGNEMARVINQTLETLSGMTP